MNKEQLTFYIDESCHLEHDHFPVMCIGYIKVPKEQTEEMKQCIKAIKRRHNILQFSRIRKFRRSRDSLWTACLCPDMPMKRSCLRRILKG